MEINDGDNVVGRRLQGQGTSACHAGVLMWDEPSVPHLPGNIADGAALG